MMYQSKMVACVKVAGRILREDGGTVLLPFGSEYTIYLKNKHTTKALVDVTVDGRQVVKGLIVDPNSSVELERFVDDLQSGRKLRFIERTEEIESYRGIKEEDGLIYISYTFERETPLNFYGVPYYQPYQPSYDPYWYNISWTADVPVMKSARGMSSGVNTSCFASMSAGPQASAGDAGITVEGGYSGQSFTYGNIGILENETHSMVIQLKGTSDSLPVAKPVTVKTKKTCPSCGREWPTYYSYCPSDQTYLRF